MKIMMYGFLRYGAWETFFVIFDYFLPFYPPNNLGNFHFEKTKKMPGDIIILHKCIINDNHMMYGSWDMKCDRHNFLSFWVFFYFFGTFTPIITQKIQIKKKKEKKNDWVSSFYTSVPKIMIISYTVPEILRVTDVIVILHFGLFFRSFNPLTAWKIKIKNKKEKKPGDIINLLKCTKNHDHMLNCS